MKQRQTLRHITDRKISYNMRYLGVFLIGTQRWWNRPQLYRRSRMTLKISDDVLRVLSKILKLNPGTNPIKLTVFFCNFTMISQCVCHTFQYSFIHQTVEPFTKESYFSIILQDLKFYRVDTDCVVWVDINADLYQNILDESESSFMIGNLFFCRWIIEL